MTLILDLTPEQKAERRLGIGGSDAGAVMRGEWYHLWQLKTGRIEEEDLSDNLSVLLGRVTEQLNLYLFEHATGMSIIRRGEVCVHPYFSFARCTLDGFVDGNVRATVQAKWTNPWMKLEELEQKTMAQCHHEMLVCGCDLAYLPILTGKPSHEIVEIERNEDYAAKLLNREQEFWSYVEDDTPPPDAPPIDAPVRPSLYRTVDMSLSNAWGEHAGVWLATIAATKRNGTAAKGLRELIEDDVGHAYGKGVAVKRSKDGKLLIHGDKNA